MRKTRIKKFRAEKVCQKRSKRGEPSVFESLTSGVKQLRAKKTVESFVKRSTKHIQVEALMSEIKQKKVQKDHVKCPK